MNRLLRPVTSPTALNGWLLILRVAIAGVMLTHGIPKMQGMLAGNWQFADPLGIGEAPSLVLTVFAEVVCSLLILIGFLTRWATIPLLITMAVAFFIIHGNDPFGEKEMPLLYALVYGTLFFTGAGRYSVDARRGDL